VDISQYINGYCVFFDMALKNSFSGKNILECGCDETGRGALAGPLYVAAVVFPVSYQNENINDSKQLSQKERENLRTVIERDALSFSVVSISEKTIDEINILNATFLGMNKAIMSLQVTPELLLIDGNRFKNQTPYPHQCCIKGDAHYLSIAAASILAKTYRDAYMEKLAEEYPQYEWKINKGYPTPRHQQIIMEQGKTPYHRNSFKLKNQLRLEF
jgi:ribonuclease HII